MKLSEFNEQDKFCRENNTPEGVGCRGCPARDKEHCADALRNLCGKFMDSINDKPNFYRLSRELTEHYGLTRWNQLALFKGELEFPE